MSRVYYNEFDREKAEWLRELIKAGVIAPGEVDERSITDVQPGDLMGFTQCHFFAGIGVWSYALRESGWGDDRAVWTGSCPCPSFSSAGKGQGFDDPRHLWPDWFRLIRECKPPVVFGEQVEAAIRHGWLDLVQTDLEKQAYAVGKAVLSSAGVGGSDIRHRLYWVADHAGNGRREGFAHSGRSTAGTRTQGYGAGLGCRGDSGGLAHTNRSRSDARRRDDAEMCGVSEAQCGTEHGTALSGGSGEAYLHPATDALKGFWRGADWLFCTDGRWRPVEAGSQSLVDGSAVDLGRLRNLGVPEDAIQKAIAEIGFPLGHGTEGRLMRLRGYGDAINSESAKVFIHSYMEAVR